MLQGVDKCQRCGSEHKGACPPSKPRLVLNSLLYIARGVSASEQFIHNMRRNEFALLNYIKLFFLSALKLPQLFGKQVEDFFMVGAGSYIFTGIVLGFTVFEVFWTSRKLYRAKNKNIELKFDVGLSYASSAMFIGLSIGAVILPAVMQVVLTYATVGFVLFMMFRSVFSLILEARMRAKALQDGKREVAEIYKENIWHHSLMVFGSLAVAALFIVFLTVPVASWPIFVTLAVLGVVYPVVCFIKGLRMHNSHKANIKASKAQAATQQSNALDTESPRSQSLGKVRDAMDKNCNFDAPHEQKLLTTLPPVPQKNPKLGFWEKTLEKGVRFYDHVERKKVLFSQKDATERWAIFLDRVTLKARKITARIVRIKSTKKPEQLALEKQNKRLEFLKDLLTICFRKNGPEGTGVLGGASAIEQLKALVSLSTKPFQGDTKTAAKAYAEKAYRRYGIFDSEYHNRSELEALRKTATTLIRQELCEIPYEIYNESTRDSIKGITMANTATSA